MKQPTIHPTAWVAEGAIVKGEVTLQENANVWFNAVLRGDTAPITVGKNSNVQDGSVLHVDKDCPLVIGDNVTVGHGAILHGCTVEEEALIGMGAIILNGAVICSSPFLTILTKLPICFENIYLKPSPLNSIKFSFSTAFAYAQDFSSLIISTGSSNCFFATS